MVSPHQVYYNFHHASLKGLLQSFKILPITKDSFYISIL
ncbi:hypothetical protein HPHPA16_0300 [Helicobacter pylori Hp A-16]|nr:hypothetical protein HPHPA16_0300 [Helicobacter pylori Hp A-16]